MPSCQLQNTWVVPLVPSGFMMCGVGPSESSKFWIYTDDSRLLTSLVWHDHSCHMSCHVMSQCRGPCPVQKQHLSRLHKPQPNAWSRPRSLGKVPPTAGGSWWYGRYSPATIEMGCCWRAHTNLLLVTPDSRIWTYHFFSASNVPSSFPVGLPSRSLVSAKMKYNRGRTCGRSKSRELGAKFLL